MTQLTTEAFTNIRPILSSHPYPLPFATGTGSHAFGCAGPTSDLDIHGVHLLPLSHVLGMNEHSHETIERKVGSGNAHPALEIATHDLKKFIMLLLKGNGNVLEDLYSPIVLVTSPLHERLQVLGRGCITKKCSLHYRGMAFNQQRNLQNNEVKKLIHMYRCLLMGIHLMRTGTIEMNLPTLAGEYGYHKPVSMLITRKTSGEQFPPMTESVVSKHLATFDTLMQQLEHEAEVSALPEQPTQETRRELEQLLIETRLQSELHDYERYGRSILNGCLQPMRNEGRDLSPTTKTTDLFTMRMRKPSTITSSAGSLSVAIGMCSKSSS